MLSYDVLENVILFLLEIYTGFLAVKECRKSVEIWRSYCQWFRWSAF